MRHRQVAKLIVFSERKESEDGSITWTEFMAIVQQLKKLTLGLKWTDTRLETALWQILRVDETVNGRFRGWRRRDRNKGKGKGKALEEEEMEWEDTAEDTEKGQERGKEKEKCDNIALFPFPSLFRQSPLPPVAPTPSLRLHSCLRSPSAPLVPFPVPCVSCLVLWTLSL